MSAPEIAVSHAHVQARFEQVRTALEAELEYAATIKRHAARTYLAGGGASAAVAALEAAARRNGESWADVARRIDALRAIVDGLGQLAVIAEYRELGRINTSAARRRLAEIRESHADLIATEL